MRGPRKCGDPRERAGPAKGKTGVRSSCLRSPRASVALLDLRSHMAAPGGAWRPRGGEVTVGHCSGGLRGDTKGVTGRRVRYSPKLCARVRATSFPRTCHPRVGTHARAPGGHPHDCTAPSTRSHTTQTHTHLRVPAAFLRLCSVSPRRVLRPLWPNITGEMAEGSSHRGQATPFENILAWRAQGLFATTVWEGKIPNV